MLATQTRMGFLIYHVFFLAMPKKVSNAKIACLDFSLQKAKMQLGVSVIVEDPEKLEAIRKRLAMFGLRLVF